MIKETLPFQSTTSNECLITKQMYLHFFENANYKMLSEGPQIQVLEGVAINALQLCMYIYAALSVNILSWFREHALV